MNREKEIKRVSSLITNKIIGNISADEDITNSDWCNELYHTKITSEEYNRYKFASESDDWNSIVLKAKQKETTTPFLRYAIIYAAAAIVVAICSWWLITSTREVAIPTTPLGASIDVTDFITHKATLQLPQGKSIDLSRLNSQSAKNKLLDHYGIEYEDSILSYKNTDVTKIAEWHTLVVPRGGEYAITLPDSTQVWLNAETSLKFPTLFTGDKRKVTLISGEAYFKVAKDTQKPFFVEIGGITVQVTGTEFNISAYPESTTVATTLVNGGINLISAKQTIIVKPSEQALFEKSNGKISKHIVDVNQYTSWRSGVYEFNDTNLKKLTNVMERWYDVEFVFLNEKLKDIHFSGAIVRNKPLSFILDMIKETRMIDYSISGNTIYIRNK